MRIIKIGNAKGIILPEVFFKNCAIGDEVTIKLKDKYIEIAKINKKREGWDEAFKQMAINGDDKLIIPDLFIAEEIADW